MYSSAFPIVESQAGQGLAAIESIHASVSLSLATTRNSRKEFQGIHVAIRS
jgi:hypothetical protein